MGARSGHVGALALVALALLTGSADGLLWADLLWADLLVLEPDLLLGAGLAALTAAALVAGLRLPVELPPAPCPPGGTPRPTGRPRLPSPSRTCQASPRAPPASHRSTS